MGRSSWQTWVGWGREQPHSPWVKVSQAPFEERCARMHLDNWLRRRPGAVGKVLALGIDPAGDDVPEVPSYGKGLRRG